MKLRRVLATLILILAVGFSNLCSAAALRYGDKGDEVKEIQTYLIAQSLLHVAADGVYGSATVNAIKDFQSALGLESTPTSPAIMFPNTNWKFPALK